MKKLILLLFTLGMLSVPNKSFAQLVAGDLAFIGYNTDTPDGFAFITLKTIPANEVIYFSDNGWNTNNFRNTTSESFCTYTAPVAGLPIGTIVNITETSANAFSATTGTFVLSTGSFSLSAGDQMLAYQSDAPTSNSNIVFITGIHGDDQNIDGTTSWTSAGNVISNSESTLPTGLTNGTNAVSLFPSSGTEQDNAKYNGTLTGDSNTVRALINDRTNWTTNDASAIAINPSDYPTPAITASVSCAAPTAQSTTAVFGTETSATLTLNSFTAPAGGADGYAVYINNTNSFTAPTDGAEPVADLTWNGSGQQAVYFGTSASPTVTVSDLAPGTQYFYQIYAYNDCSGTETYETTGLNANDTTQTGVLTITGLTATNKGYDGATTTAATGTAILSGVNSGASNVFLSGSPAFNFTSANVGTGITVNTIGYTLVGTDASKYTLTQPTLSADILAASLTITGIAATNKVYDDSTTGSATGTASLSGIIGADDVSLGGSPVFTFASANIGTGITVNTTGYTISGTDSGNYTLTQPTLTADITAKTLTIIGLTATDKVYDDTTTGSATGTASLSGLEAGDDVSLGGSPIFTFASANVGTGITVNTTGYTISGTDSGNYTLTQPTLSADITAKPLFISGLTANDKIYDDTTVGSATGTASAPGVEAGDDVSLGGSPVFTFASANVGTGITVNTTGYTISGTDSGNYIVLQPTLAADITAATLTITGITGDNKVYDGTTTGSATGTAVLSGLEAGDDVSLGGSPVFTFASANVGTGITVNTTGYTISGTDSGNYTLTQPTLSADITANTVTWIGVTNTDWSESSNWDTGLVPTSTADVSIPAGTPFSVTTSALVTVNSIDIASGASLIAGSIVNAQVTYNRILPTTNWYLVAAPLNDATQDDIIANHTFASGTGSNIGLGAYDNNSATSPWTYANSASTGPIVRGYGVAMKLAAPGNVAITGEIGPFNVTIPITNGSDNSFNLLGNPYTSFINSFTFTNQNSSNLEEQTIWLWDGTQYITRNAMTPLEIAPAQAFFVEAFNGLPGGTANLNYSSANQTHQSDTFMKQDGFTNFKLFIESDTDKKSTQVFYYEDKTTSFDDGYDSKMFGGATTDFAVFTELLTNNDGRHLAIQTLPDDNHETMVIPVGLIASAGKEITFSAEAMNLPNGLEVYLEDRINNISVNLSQETYKVTLTENADSVGQFYITLSAKSLSTDDLIQNLANVSVYKSAKQELTITGLQADAKLSLYSILGKESFNTKVTSNGVSKVALPYLADGVYIVKLITTQGEVTRKIILD